MNHHSLNQLISTLVLALATGAVSAQEVISQEELAKAVPRALARVADFDNLQFKTDADGGKAFGMKAQHYAAVVIPEKGLTKEALAKSGKQILPVGQLWLVKLSPAVKDVTTPGDKLRLVTFSVKEEDYKLPLFLLGVRQQGESGKELVVYAKAKEPLLALPLKKCEAKQDLPLEVNLRQGVATLGMVDINLFGEYQAVMPVGEREE